MKQIIGHTFVGLCIVLYCIEEEKWPYEMVF